MNDAAAALADARTAAGYRLRLGDRRFRGRAGGRRGNGPGSSLEFFDFRDYTPGDDLRHIDWRSYARTEQLRVRLHEAEVAPHMDVLVDTSASMASTAGKERAAHALAGALLGWSRHEGSAGRMLALGGGTLAPDEIAFAGAAAPALPQVPLRRGGARVLLTDGLWRQDPTPLLQQLLSGCAQFVCLQLLDPWELAPTAGPACTLVDVEDGSRAELPLDAALIAGYRERLQRLLAQWRTTVLAGGGMHVVVTADALAVMCARDLLPAAVVEPA
jgi:hypothetical protein